jgi:outer membrane cobalamin receptor
MSKSDKNHIVNDLQPYKQDVVNDNFSNDIRGNVDYTKRITDKFNVESGFAFERYTRYLDVKFDQFDYSQELWIHNPLYTNKFDYYENIYSGYVNVITNLKGFEINIGLRAEYTDRLLKQTTLDTGYAFNGINYFPGFSISKQFGNSSVSLALTNRINRPDEYMMNPFPEFEDDYFCSEGNPGLLPEIVRSLDLGYQTMFGPIMLSANLFYKQTENKIETKMIIRQDNEKLQILYHNDCFDKTTGIELSIKSQPAKWWMIMANSNVYYYYIQMKIDNQTIENQLLSYDFMLMNAFNIGKTTSIQLISYYQSKTAASQGDLSDFYFVDLGIEQKFLKDRISLNLQVKDVFRSMNFSLTTHSDDFSLVGDFNNESPILLLTASFQISKYLKKTTDVETDFDMQ